jgi:hypothetical protein
MDSKEIADWLVAAVGTWARPTVAVSDDRTLRSDRSLSKDSRLGARFRSNTTKTADLPCRVQTRRLPICDTGLAD